MAKKATKKPNTRKQKTQKGRYQYILRSADGQERVYFSDELTVEYLAEAKRRFEEDTGRQCHKARYRDTQRGDEGTDQT